MRIFTSAWLILVASAVMEAVWATALGESQGLSLAVPTAVFLGALAASMWGLSRATRQIPIGTAYAVWTGLGAALTVGVAVARGAESLTVPKALFLLGIIACVVALQLLPSPPRHPDSSQSQPPKPQLP